jgi:hypothetical protein
MISLSGQSACRYRRHLADAPIGGRPVEIVLRVRRFFCDNPGCPARTFAEQVPGLTTPWARRTEPLRNALETIELALAGRAAAGAATRPQSCPGHCRATAQGRSLPVRSPGRLLEPHRLVAPRHDRPLHEGHRRAPRRGRGPRAAAGRALTDGERPGTAFEERGNTPNDRPVLRGNDGERRGPWSGCALNAGLVGR